MINSFVMSSILVIAVQPVYVPPSGDATGVSDYATISAMIASEQLKSFEGTIELSGTYYVDHGLVTGDATNPLKAGVCIRGNGNASIWYVGPSMDDYILRVQGTVKGSAPRVENIRLIANHSNHKARGLLVNGQTYIATVRNVQTMWTSQIAFDCVNNWGGGFYNCRAYFHHGIGLRSFNCNNTVFHKMHFHRVQGAWHSSLNNEATDEMMRYEMGHGRAATKTQYGAAYCEDWPSPDDISVISTGGTVVQTPVEERACVWLNQRNVKFDNILFENCNGGDLPLVYLTEYAEGVSFERMYFEKNLYGVNAIRIAGGSTDKSTTFGFTFEDIFSYDAPIGFPQLRAASFIRTTGYVSDVVVDQFKAWNLETSIVICDGGHLFTTECRRCRTQNNSIHPKQWTTAVNGGVIEKGVPYGADHGQIAK